MRTLFTFALALSFMFATALAAEAPARKPSGKPSFYKAPSEESAAAREKRLRRECKGRPNAGACLGHASR